MKTVSATKIAASATAIAVAVAASSSSANTPASQSTCGPTEWSTVRNNEFNSVLPPCSLSEEVAESSTCSSDELKHYGHKQNQQQQPERRIKWICSGVPRGGSKEPHDDPSTNKFMKGESQAEKKAKSEKKRQRRKKSATRSQQQKGDTNQDDRDNNAGSRSSPHYPKTTAPNAKKNVKTNKMVEEILEHGDDYYQVLGVSRTATTEVIKKAYRKRAVQTHPDKTQGDRRAFDLVSEAHDVLSDETKKHLYDQFGKRGLDPHGPHASGMPRSAQDLFRSMFQQQQQQRQAPRQNQTVRYQLQVSLEDLYQGATQSITIGPPNRHHMPPGRFRDQKLVQVHIPKGSISGQSIVMSGEMDFSEDETPGDLVFILTQLPHPTFTRKGHDLAIELTITLEEAICGVERSIQHLDGRKIWIGSARQQQPAKSNQQPHAGTDHHEAGNHTEVPDPPAPPLFIQTGDVHVLKGQGMPKRDSPNDQFGDLYIQYRVQMPKPSKQGTLSLTEEERKELARILAKLEGSTTSGRSKKSETHHDSGEEIHYLHPATSADFGRASGRVTFEDDEPNTPREEEFSHPFFGVGRTHSNFYFGSNFGQAFGGSGGNPYDDNDDGNVQCQQM